MRVEMENIESVGGLVSLCSDSVQFPVRDDRADVGQASALHRQAEILGRVHWPGPPRCWRRSAARTLGPSKRTLLPILINGMEPSRIRLLKVPGLQGINRRS